MNKTAVILANTGTPDAPTPKAVGRYLRQFLSDKRVISLPLIPRQILVNGIIVPFRAPRSARLYQKVWTEKGSPLLAYSHSLKEKLQKLLGSEYEVMLGMRYGNPSLKDALLKVKQQQFHKLVLVPLFPQYASSTTGSILELVHAHLKSWNNIPALKTVKPFFMHPQFIECVAHNIRGCDPLAYDHIIFSYHGLPLQHLRDNHQGKDCRHFDCTTQINKENQFCYHAACYATTRLLAQALQLPSEKYTVCFQSRFSKNWLAPFADSIIRQKARDGARKVLVVSPSFVTDCLETIVEIGFEYRELFEKNGGQTLDWVHSLNDQEQWVSALHAMITA